VSEDPASERKFVTILRADITRSTDLVASLDPEEAVGRLEPAMKAMRAAVRQFGGVISKEMGDGLAAVFGAPVADDNHAPLACHAALDLVQRVAALGDPELQVRVGLHSGLAIMYVITSEFSKIYEIGGAAQHLAARLESEAEPGQIYASEACQKLSEGHVRFEYLGRKLLRGYAEPAPLYRVVAAGGLSSWQVRKMRSVSRFVGRASEMAQLRDAAKACLANGQTVCLIGDPGIGKSRLAHEFVQDLEAEGWRLIETGCSPNLQGAPFAALKGLLRSVLEQRPAGSPDPRQGLPQIYQSAIDAVLDLPMEDEQWLKLEPEARGKAISEASLALVENLARRQPIALLVEDLHWLDRASAPVVAALASLQVPNLLTLVTSRPTGAPDWLGECNASIVALRPLDSSAGSAMLDDILGPSSTTLELKSRISRHTANVPLFVEEVCRRLKESGVLLGHWGDLTLDKPVDDLGIPESIQGVIAARLDRLTKQERILMQTAAALGPRSRLATLREVFVLPEVLLRSSLAALDRAELLAIDEAGTDEVFEFAHEMVRQVAYDSMIGPAREDVHARILLALEADRDSREEIDRLCHHATQSKDWVKVFGYGGDVARKCVARSAFADATTYYELAIDALDKTPLSRGRETRAIDLRTEARVALMSFGRVAEALDLSKEAERRATAIDDIGRKVAAMAFRASAQNFYSTPVEAIETSEQVVELAEKWGDRGWLNHALYGLGQAYFIAGRYLDADRQLARACAQLMEPQAVASIGTTVQYMLLMCCMMKSMTSTVLGEMDAAQHFQDRAQEIADGSGRPYDRVVAAYSGASLMLGRGDPATAAVILDEAFALAQQYGVRLFVPVIACHRGMAYLEQDRLDEAKEILSEARETAKALGYKSTELRASIYLARVLSQVADGRDALRMLREATNTARQQGFAGLEAEALLCEAMIAPAETEADKAAIARHLRASIEIASRNGAKPLVLRAERLLGGILVQDTGIRAI
jgi:predicted ATPase/class 3 adenylate cyclase